ncbi:MAG: hypothetical protein PHI40_08690 [Caldisericia bacterium]|nr:hypothetical protein [Caldisericia bacterium]
MKRKMGNRICSPIHALPEHTKNPSLDDLQNMDLTKEILKSLLSQGYLGVELTKRFIAQKSKINTAIDLLHQEADDIAEGRKKGYSIEEVFGLK